MNSSNNRTPSELYDEMQPDYNASGEFEVTGGLDLFATLRSRKCGKKIQHVAKRSNIWQKDPMPGKKSLRPKNELIFHRN